MPKTRAQAKAELAAQYPRGCVFRNAKPGEIVRFLAKTVRTRGRPMPVGNHLYMVVAIPPSRAHSALDLDTGQVYEPLGSHRVIAHSFDLYIHIGGKK